jgi:hypothetical protein
LTTELVSSPFRVESKKQREVFKAPRVYGCVPGEGAFAAQTVAWIRGKDFAQTAKSLLVSFGDMPAKVIEVGPSYVFAEVPVRADLTTRTSVEIKVANVYAKGGPCWSERTAMFTYDDPVMLAARANRDTRRKAKYRDQKLVPVLPLVPPE